MAALVYDELGVIINNVFALVMSALLIVVPILTSAMLLHRWKIEKKDDSKYMMEGGQSERSIGDSTIEESKSELVNEDL